MRDAAARALPAQQPRIAALGIDAFEQCELDQRVGLLVVDGDAGEPAPHRQLVSCGPQVHPGFAEPAVLEKQLAHLAAGGEIRGLELRPQRLVDVVDRRAAIERQPKPAPFLQQPQVEQPMQIAGRRERLGGATEQPLGIVGQCSEVVEHGIEAMSCQL